MNFLLLSASVCAKLDQQSIVDPRTFIAEAVPQVPRVEQQPNEEIFKISGPVNGVCSSEFNSHPLAIRNIDSAAI